MTWWAYDRSELAFHGFERKCDRAAWIEESPEFREETTASIKRFTERYVPNDVVIHGSGDAK